MLDLPETERGAPAGARSRHWPPISRRGADAVRSLGLRRARLREQGARPGEELGATTGPVGVIRRAGELRAAGAPLRAIQAALQVEHGERVSLDALARVVREAAA